MDESKKKLFKKLKGFSLEMIAFIAILLLGYIL